MNKPYMNMASASPLDMHLDSSLGCVHNSTVMLLGAALCLQLLPFLWVYRSLIIPCLQSTGKES